MDEYGDGDESMDHENHSNSFDFFSDADNSMNNISRTQNQSSLQHNISTASAANSISNNQANRLSEKVENVARAIYNELEQNVKNYGEQSMGRVAK